MKVKDNKKSKHKFRVMTIEEYCAKEHCGKCEYHNGWFYCDYSDYNKVNRGQDKKKPYKTKNGKYIMVERKMNIQEIIDSINHCLNSDLDDITLTDDDLQTIKKALINYKLQDMQNTMYRPCFVDGKKALFHRWTAYNVIDYAIVEYEDGTVDIVHPQSIKFVPGKFNEYNFTEGELYEKMRNILVEHGYDVKMFNLANLTRSDSWNPLRDMKDAEKAMIDNKEKESDR